MTKVSSQSAQSPAPTEPFSWKVIAGKAAEALVMGLVFGLLKSVFGRDGVDESKLRAILKEFSDDIVNRVTANVRKEIRDAISDDNMRRLGVLAVLGVQNLRKYEELKKERYLIKGEEYVEKTVAVARSLGVPALGVYLAMFSVYVAILREMGLVGMVVEEIREAQVHVDRMLDKALDEATGTAGDLQRVKMVEERNSMGDALYRYRITVNGEVRFFERREGFSKEAVVSEFREVAMVEARASITKNLVEPSRKIMDVWSSASVAFSSGKHQEK